MKAEREGNDEAAASMLNTFRQMLREDNDDSKNEDNNEKGET